ncbi:MAG: hypothetical protein IPK75_13425 [Acidobacteria bacterium]|jgi:hypothetical protein|nr:hypothetical protein [Acidobacteriota bacterium]
MLRALILSGVLSLAFAAPALAAGTRDAAACKAMQATLAPRQTEIADLTAARDAAAELTEVSGEAWEDVEIHRLASKAHAAAADEAKAAYEAAKAKLARDELALQDAVVRFNDDVAAFNTRCTSKG